MAESAFGFGLFTGWFLAALCAIHDPGDPVVMIQNGPGGDLCLPIAPEGGRVIAAPYRGQPLARRDRLRTNENSGHIALQLPNRHPAEIRGAHSD